MLHGVDYSADDWAVNNIARHTLFTQLLRDCKKVLGVSSGDSGITIQLHFEVLRGVIAKSMTVPA